MKKTNKVRISSESVNSYGTRILTAGIDIAQYQRNPVLLYMHERGQVIGYVADIHIENNELVGCLMFDEATELSSRCKKQWEFGSLKMVSVGLDIVSMSDDPALILPEQTAPTITQSKLIEVSVVDIGANDDAIALHRDGIRIQLGKDAANALPLLHYNNNNSINPQNPKEMDKEKLALLLGLTTDADDSAISTRISELMKDGNEAATLRKEIDTLRAARVQTLVDAAIAEKKVAEDKKQFFLDLGAKIGADELQKTLDAMSPQVKLSSIVNPQTPEPAHREYTKLSDVPADLLLKLRSENPAEYKRLYKAEYGIDCQLQ